MSRPTEPRRKRDACPLCGSAASGAHRPFCSQGCRDRDLLNWLGDGYRLPGPPADEADLDGREAGLDSERQPPL